MKRIIQRRSQLISGSGPPRPPRLRHYHFLFFHADSLDRPVGPHFQRVGIRYRRPQKYVRQKKEQTKTGI